MRVHKITIDLKTKTSTVEIICQYCDHEIILTNQPANYLERKNPPWLCEKCYNSTFDSMLCGKCHYKYDTSNGLHETEAHKEIMRKTAKKMGLIYGKIIGKKYGAINGRKYCKFTDQQVREIRKECLAGSSRRFLAKKYGVSSSTVSSIMRGERYTWIK
jgi:hypothetical protein